MRIALEGGSVQGRLARTKDNSREDERSCKEIGGVARAVLRWGRGRDAREEEDKGVRDVWEAGDREEEG